MCRLFLYVWRSRHTCAIPTERLYRLSDNTYVSFCNYVSFIDSLKFPNQMELDSAAKKVGTCTHARMHTHKSIYIIYMYI